MPGDEPQEIEVHGKPARQGGYDILIVTCPGCRRTWGTYPEATGGTVKFICQQCNITLKIKPLPQEASLP